MGTCWWVLVLRLGVGRWALGAVWQWALGVGYGPSVGRWVLQGGDGEAWSDATFRAAYLATAESICAPASRSEGVFFWALGSVGRWVRGTVGRWALGNFCRDYVEVNSSLDSPC